MVLDELSLLELPLLDEVLSLLDDELSPLDVELSLLDDEPSLLDDELPLLLLDDVVASVEPVEADALELEDVVGSPVVIGDPVDPVSSPGLTPPSSAHPESMAARTTTRGDRMPPLCHLAALR